MRQKIITFIGGSMNLTQQVLRDEDRYSIRFAIIDESRNSWLEREEQHFAVAKRDADKMGLRSAAGVEAYDPHNRPISCKYETYNVRRVSEYHYIGMRDEDMR